MFTVGNSILKSHSHWAFRQRSGPLSTCHTSDQSFCVFSVRKSDAKGVSNVLQRADISQDVLILQLLTFWQDEHVTSLLTVIIQVCYLNANFLWTYVYKRWAQVKLTVNQPRYVREVTFPGQCQIFSGAEPFVDTTAGSCKDLGGGTGQVQA